MEELKEAAWDLFKAVEWLETMREQDQQKQKWRDRVAEAESNVRAELAIVIEEASNEL